MSFRENGRELLTEDRPCEDRCRAQGWVRVVKSIRNAHQKLKREYTLGFPSEPSEGANLLTT